MRFQVTLELWETEASSTYRELRSIECGLLLIAPEARGTVVRYGNDNYSAVRAVMFGSTKPDCQRIAVKIHEIVEAHQIELEMVWRRRSMRRLFYAIGSPKNLIFRSIGSRRRALRGWQACVDPFRLTGLLLTGATSWGDFAASIGL